MAQTHFFSSFIISGADDAWYAIKLHGKYERRRAIMRKKFITTQNELLYSPLTTGKAMNTPIIKEFNYEVPIKKKKKKKFWGRTFFNSGIK